MLDRIAGMAFAWGLALALGVGSAAAQPNDQAPKDQEEADRKLAYVASIYPERIYYCRVTPRGQGTSTTSIQFDFELDGEGPVDARMEVIGRVSGRRVSARMRWRGTASTSGKDATITLTQVYDYDADPLPGGAKWSDPDGDVITLTVDDYASMGSQPYILTGTQESEFGINDMRCLDGGRPRR